MARPLTIRALLVRTAAAGVTALALGALCGVALVSDPAPAPVEPTVVRRRPGPAPAPTPAPAPVALLAQEAPAVEVTPPVPVAPAPPPEPVDLVRELPDAQVMAQLAALLAGPDDDLAVEVAEALSVAPSPEGRALLVAHLRRPVDDAPGVDDLACLEALAAIGQSADLEAVLPWARRADPAGVLAAWCVRAICARERVEPPEDLREVEAPAGPRG